MADAPPAKAPIGVAAILQKRLNSTASTSTNIADAYRSEFFGRAHKEIDESGNPQAVHLFATGAALWPRNEGVDMSNVSRAGTPVAPNNAVNRNHFARSVESRAQIIDAAKIARATDEGEVLNIYRLRPLADADDGRWGNAPSNGELLVAARTSGDARVVAAGCEVDFMTLAALPAEDVTTINASTFKSEKLYTVILVRSGCSGLRRGPVDEAFRGREGELSR